MKLRNQLLSGYMIIFIVMIVIMVITYKSLTELIRTDDWETHTQKVIDHANQIHKLLIDMETGQRGFLITGEDVFLEPYDNGLKEYDASLENLRLLISDNPAQVRLLEEIAALAIEWRTKAAIPEINARLDADKGRGDDEVVYALIAQKTGKSIMDTIRSRLKEFVDQENQLLAARHKKSELATLNSSALVVSGTLMAIAVGIISMYYSVRSVTQSVGGDPSEIEALTKEIANGNWDVANQDKSTSVTGIAASVQSMATNLRQKEQEKNTLIAELQKALTEVKELRDILPICSHCKQIRNEEGAWDQVEKYIQKNIDVEFSHSICPKCAEKYY